MMLTSRNKKIVALLLAATIVAFTVYTMYAKSCACKKAATTNTTHSPKTTSTVVVTPSPVSGEKKPVDHKQAVAANHPPPQPVLA
jgi:hypothetical protein